MTPARAWGLFAAILIAIAVWFVFSQRHSAPPADIAALELAAADFNNTPSCYTLGAVLAANGLSGEARDRSAKVLWTMRVKDEWTMRVDRGKSWRAYTFLREGTLAMPARVASSDDLPQVSVEEAIYELLAKAKQAGALRVPRCAAVLGGSP